MNALLLSAVLGVIMMFSSFLLKRKASVRTHCHWRDGDCCCLLNILEMYGTRFFNINTEGMMHFDRFALLFNTIAILFNIYLFCFVCKGYGKSRD